ncbi:MAG TPA: hypothetical protein VJX67_27320, partial [Blastocatellia bacterium]|nr:hypothetical protein [Blastocatellia bacterium]
GLTVATGTSSVCGGTLTTTAPNVISFSGGTVPSSGTCTIVVTVTGAVAGVQNNTTGNIGSANGGKGATSNTATITVVAPATISKAFGVTNIPVGGTTTLTFTLTNPNTTVALTGVAFTDPFPSGLIVANPASATDACGGTFSPNPGDTTLAFSGGTIAAGGSCTISVKVQLTTGGTKTNTTSAITSANGGTGAPSNPATVVTFDKCLTDSAGNLLQFSSITGDYMYTRCSDGFTLSGTGTITTPSGVVTLTDKKADRYVSASVMSIGTGSATITFLIGTTRQTVRIVDRTPGAVCSCL